MNYNLPTVLDLVLFQYALFVGLLCVTFLVLRQFFGIEFLRHMFDRNKDRDDGKDNVKDDFKDGPGNLA